MAEFEREKKRLNLTIDAKKTAFDEASQDKLNKLLDKAIKIHDFKSTQSGALSFEYRLVKPNTFGKSVAIPPIAIALDPKIMQFLPKPVPESAKRQLIGKNFVLKNLSVSTNLEIVFELEAIRGANGISSGNHRGQGSRF